MEYKKRERRMEKLNKRVEIKENEKKKE